MTYGARWYWCDLVDRFTLEDAVEPEWDRVPADKRDRVREAWRKGLDAKLAPQRVKLWGPQIGWYRRQPKYTVTVVEAA